MKETRARVHNTPTSLEQQTFTTEVAFGLGALHAGSERLNRTCIYKTKTTHQPAPKLVGTALENNTRLSPQARTRPDVDLSTQNGKSTDQLDSEQLFISAPSSSGISHSPGVDDVGQPPVDFFFSPVSMEIPSENLSSSRTDDLSIIESPSTRFRMASQDIYLCTTIDFLAAVEAPTPSFSYFVEEINLAIISPFDEENWTRMKTHVAELSVHDKTIAAATLAVQARYLAQIHGLPTSHSMAVYHDARIRFEASLQDGTQDFNAILIIAFLLCLFELADPSDAGTIFGQCEGNFVQRMTAWSLHDCHTPLSLRIGAWLQIFHAAARRGGGPGLLSDAVAGLLPDQTIGTPSLSALDSHTDARTSIYDVVKAPIFTFYLELQKISTQVANLSHYHRSRTTSADQEEVSEIMTDIRNKIFFLWQSRPGPMQLNPGELRAQFSPAIAEPMITLIGLCIAAYYTEIVEIGRTLSDPPLASAEAKQAMYQIRHIIEGDWNASSGAKLSPGYLRPLFLYAIESIRIDDSQWAVERLKDIKSPISRSDFFAFYAKSLAEAQRLKRRRVTTKYFCHQLFGVPPPFL
ncbi:hypothetical protein OIDMADRAFT_35906 [Oidiodendron maius Zn]|uniref:Transcription factor domain-containing protein n=1 Tax=Oidiodendron maius (strain Zn) TaxID=913774 RepID=A0A0C3GPC6_OIDMZ|nr:hypothetical protein OIDMADRAFT_35906 [Oidiodendron maius Zn]